MSCNFRKTITYHSFGKTITLKNESWNQSKEAMRFLTLSVKFTQVIYFNSHTFTLKNKSSPLIYLFLFSGLFPRADTSSCKSLPMIHLLVCNELLLHSVFIPSSVLSQRLDHINSPRAASQPQYKKEITPTLQPLIRQ